MAHYFTIDEIVKVAKLAGLEVRTFFFCFSVLVFLCSDFFSKKKKSSQKLVDEAKYCTVSMKNRQNGTSMNRCYIHAALRRNSETDIQPPSSTTPVVASTVDSTKAKAKKRSQTKSIAGYSIAHRDLLKFTAVATALLSCVYLIRKRRGG